MTAIMVVTRRSARAVAFGIRAAWGGESGVKGRSQALRGGAMTAIMVVTRRSARAVAFGIRATWGGSRALFWEEPGVFVGGVRR